MFSPSSPICLIFLLGPEEHLSYGRNQSFASCHFIRDDFIYFFVPRRVGLRTIVLRTKPRRLRRFVPFAKFRVVARARISPDGSERLLARATDTSVRSQSIDCAFFCPSVPRFPIGPDARPILSGISRQRRLYIYIFFFFVCFIHMYHLVLSPTLGVQ